jgi:hypothetical protein
MTRPLSRLLPQSAAPRPKIAILAAMIKSRLFSLSLKNQHYGRCYGAA